MSVRDQVRRAYYGAAIGSDLAAEIGLPVLASTDTSREGSRALRPYILQKHYLSGRFWTGFWYFGRATDLSGRIVPGCANLDPYPFRIFDDAGNGGYGSLILGTQGAVGRIVLLGGRCNLSGVIDNTNASSTGVTPASGDLHSDWGIGNATWTTDNTWASLATANASTKQDIVSAVAVDAVGSAADPLLIKGLCTANTAITDSTAGTASTTFAAITATVTSTVVADALAQLAANENRRLGLFGKVIDGTSSAQSIYLNGSVDDGDQAATADNGISGEILLTGVVELNGIIQGDI